MLSIAPHFRVLSKYKSKTEIIVGMATQTIVIRIVSVASLNGGFDDNTSGVAINPKIAIIQLLICIFNVLILLLLMPSVYMLSKAPPDWI